MKDKSHTTAESREKALSDSDADKDTTNGQSRFAAMSYEERRATLNAAGLHHVSAAPPPIKPVRGTGTSVRPHTTPRAPNWREWSFTPEVSLWQACALSLNIEPHSMRKITRYRDFNDPTFEQDSFPTAEAKAEYELRHRVLLANLSDSRFFSTDSRRAYQLPDQYVIELAEFAAWADAVVSWQGLPPELVALAQEPKAPEAAAANSGTPEKAAPNLAVNRTPKPRMTEAIADAFPPPKGTSATNWKKTLSDPPKWMREARTSAGAAGISALWNPALFAVCMVSQRHIGKDSAGTIIHREFADWASQWESLAEHL